MTSQVACYWWSCDTPASAKVFQVQVPHLDMNQLHVVPEIQPITRANRWRAFRGATGAGERQSKGQDGFRKHGAWSLQAPSFYTAASLSWGLLLLLLLLLPLLLSSWPLGDTTSLCVLSEALGAESLSAGEMWAGPGDAREEVRDKVGR